MSRTVALLAVLSIAAVLGSFAVGYYKIPLSRLPGVLLGGASTELDVLVRVRLPRILAAYAIGAALATAGSAYQGMFKNPLVSPEILGVSAGAGLGAALSITLEFPYYITQTMAFVFGLAAAALCYLAARRVRFGQTVSMILAGTMIQTLATAMTTLLKYLADPNDALPAITFWLMGSLTKVDMDALLFSAAPMAAGFLILFAMRYRLNVLTLGDEEAMSLGIDPRRTRAAAIVGATLLSAASVCMGGMIGFVGLMIPHIARWMVGPQYRRLLPVACMAGGCYLLVMDDIARSAMSMEIPLGVMTAVAGAPFFLYLITRQGVERS